MEKKYIATKRDFFSQVIYCMRTSWIIFLIQSFILLGCAIVFNTWALFISTTSIWIFGYFMSFTIHEYLHYVVLTRYSARVYMHGDIHKIAIGTNDHIRGYKVIALGLMGPGACAGISAGIYGVAKVTDSWVLIVIATIYALHTINLLPCFADGKLMIRGIFDILRRTSE